MTWVVVGLAVLVVLASLAWVFLLVRRLWRATKRLAGLVAVASDRVAEVTQRLTDVNTGRPRRSGEVLPEEAGYADPRGHRRGARG